MGDLDQKVMDLCEIDVRHVEYSDSSAIDDLGMSDVIEVGYVNKGGGYNLAGTYFL